jgi:hypothetical protein
VAAGDLCSLADVKAWLKTGDTFPATDDLLLSRLITAGSAFIESWVSRHLLSADYIDVYDGTGGRQLMLLNYPVTAISSVSVDGSPITPPIAPTSGIWSGYVFNQTGIALRGYTFPRRMQNVVIAYTAGFTAVPPEIRQACVELVCLRYKERTRIGEVSKSLGGHETVSYSQKDMSDDIKTALNQIKRVVPMGGSSTRVSPLRIGAVNFDYLDLPPTAGAPVLRWTFDKEFSLTANALGSIATATVGPVADIVFDMAIGSTNFATMTFLAGTTVAVFAGTAQSFGVGDVLTITPRTTETGMSGVSGFLADSGD